MKNRSVLVLGALLILFGVAGLLSNMGIIRFGWGQLWPLIILIAGLLFELGFFVNGRREPGLLVPAGILITYGLLFYICSVYGFHWMGTLWPLFLAGPAVGLFQLYLFGTHDNALLIPVGILGGLSAIFLMANLTELNIAGVVFPALLIVIGLIIIFNAFRKN